MDWMLGVPVEQNQGLCGLQLELTEKSDSIFFRWRPELSKISSAYSSLSQLSSL